MMSYPNIFRGGVMRYLAFAVLVLGSAALGAMGALWLAVRHLERRQFVADMDAAETGPVPLVVDVTRPELEPLPLVMDLLPACWDPPPAQPEWVTTAATTGDLTWARANMDLDDLAVDIEQGFYDLLEQTRAAFDAIQITG
jgi:hypothetical protein